MNKFLDYIQNTKTALIIASRPLDFDCIGSGLILKKYLESLGKQVKIIHPAKFKDEDKQFFRFLPFFNEIEDKDTREALQKENFDLLIMVDGANLAQFYDAQYDSSNPPDLSVYAKRIHVDHHQRPEALGGLTFHTKETSSTTEIVLTQIVPPKFGDQDIATLGYAGIVGDTGNFMWQFSASTLKVAARMLEKGANATVIIDKLFFNQSKEYLQAVKFAIEHTEFNDALGTTFLSLPHQLITRRKLDDKSLGEIKRAYDDTVSKAIPEYPRGIVMSEKEKGQISISARGNTLRNKLPLPDLFAKLGGNSGGHFNAAGAKVTGNFNQVKQKLIAALKNSL